MNIAFLSSLNPVDIHNWSGTLYYMYHSLRTSHNVTWVGGTQFVEVLNFHYNNCEHNILFEPERYSLLFGKLLSDYFAHVHYDVIICRDYFFLADLVTNIPVIYVGDTTFRLFNRYLKLEDHNFVQIADNLEKRAIQKSTHLIYSSEWAMNSAINDYHANPHNISIVEFGANISKHLQFSMPKTSDVCNLLFIGKEWERKGGDKAISIYQYLKRKKFSCTLTIVGNNPDNIMGIGDIEVYPYVDKRTEEGRNLFDLLLRRSHYLVAPTIFECFGIMFCEASAYGIPSITNNVCGVGKVIRDKKNGILLSPDAPVEKWGETIIKYFNDKQLYQKFCESSFIEFRDRLNWNVWLGKVNDILCNMCNFESIKFPTYIINADTSSSFIGDFHNELKKRHEFDIHLIDVDFSNPDTNRIFWTYVTESINIAKRNNEKYATICQPSAYFTNEYSYSFLLQKIKDAQHLNAEILIGGLSDFRQAIPMGYQLYWIAWFKTAPLLIIYESLYDKILSYKFQVNDTIDNILSLLAKYKMIIYPFICMQRLKHSDRQSTEISDEHIADEIFQIASERFKHINFLYEFSKYKTII